MENLKELLAAHLQKDYKVDTYYPRVDGNLVNEKPNFKLTWSWWGFFAGWAFFLYRKMYIIALFFFILSLAATAFPLGGIILALITGSTSFYFYTLKFYDDLKVSGYKHRDINLVKEDLAKLGGYNRWVVFVAVIFYAFLIIFSIIPVLTAFFAISIL